MEFLSYPTFHSLGRLDHKLVMAHFNLSTRPKLARYWKLNTFLLAMQDFRDKVTEIIRRTLMGTIKWWVSTKAKIRRFSIQYSQCLAQNKVRAKKHLEDRLTWAVAGGIP